MAEEIIMKLEEYTDENVDTNDGKLVGVKEELSTIYNQKTMEENEIIIKLEESFNEDDVKEEPIIIDDKYEENQDIQVKPLNDILVYEKGVNSNATEKRSYPSFLRYRVKHPGPTSQKAYKFWVRNGCKDRDGFKWNKDPPHKFTKPVLQNRRQGSVKSVLQIKTDGTATFTFTTYH